MRKCGSQLSSAQVPTTITGVFRPFRVSITSSIANAPVAIHLSNITLTRAFMAASDVSMPIAPPMIWPAQPLAWDDRLAGSVRPAIARCAASKSALEMPSNASGQDHWAMVATWSPLSNLTDTRSNQAARSARRARLALASSDRKWSMPVSRPALAAYSLDI